LPLRGVYLLLLLALVAGCGGTAPSLPPTTLPTATRALARIALPTSTRPPPTIARPTQPPAPLTIIQPASTTLPEPPRSALLAELGTGVYAAAPVSDLLAALGPIDIAKKTQLRRIWQIGQMLGRRPTVFARVGDSITASGSFLSDIGDRREVLGAHPELAAIIRYYRATVVDRVGGRVHNAFNRKSLAAKAGWTGMDILGRRGAAPVVPSPLQQEYAAVQPSVALIMFGTNDLDQTGVDYFATNLESVITQTIQAGIIPIVSTVPDRLDSPQAAARTLPFNEIIRATAAHYALPLIDYWAAMHDLPNHGLEADQVHPSVYPGHGSVTFTATGLRYGYTVRNFLTLRMLAKVRAIIIDDGPPDGEE
jgi:hypothetical protein